MKRNLLAFLATIIVAFLVVSPMAAQKPGTSPVIPLKVQIESLDSLGTACAICPDGLGQYVDGQDGVTASFSKYGGLIVDFGTAPALRSVSFIYNPAEGAPPPMSLNGLTTYTGLPSTNNAPNLQDMTYGLSQCLGMTWNHNNGGNTARTHGFRFSGGVLTTTAYVMFTCTAADNTGRCTTWEAEPKASVCNPAENVSKARVKDTSTSRGKTTVIDYGLFDMPFKLTLMRK